MSAPIMDRGTELARRRARLRAQCDQQRRELAMHAAQIELELSRIDRSVDMVRSFVSKPVLIAASIAALTMIGPRRALRWITKGTMWYGVAKRVLGAFIAFRANDRSSYVVRR
jgi:hypothetical protein